MLSAFGYVQQQEVRCHALWFRLLYGPVSLLRQELVTQPTRTNAEEAVYALQETCPVRFNSDFGSLVCLGSPTASPILIGYCYISKATERV